FVDTSLVEKLRYAIVGVASEKQWLVIVTNRFGRVSVSGGELSSIDIKCLVFVAVFKAIGQVIPAPRNRCERDRQRCAYPRGIYSVISTDRILRVAFSFPLSNSPGRKWNALKCPQ